MAGTSTPAFAGDAVPVFSGNPAQARGWYEQLHSGYAQSKFVGEVLVARAMANLGTPMLLLLNLCCIFCFSPSCFGWTPEFAHLVFMLHVCWFACVGQGWRR